eukprot:Rhum_TRINITY_DN12030_c0_g1::Rhum_TRINITY_DN12030_c0_g1_i1::g.48790::m.48790
MDDVTVAAQDIAVVLDLRFPSRDHELYGYMRGNASSVLKVLSLRLATTACAMSVVVIGTRVTVAVARCSGRVSEVFRALASVQLDEGVPCTGGANLAPLSAEALQAAHALAAKVLILTCVDWTRYLASARAAAGAATAHPPTLHMWFTFANPRDAMVLLDHRLVVASPTDAKQMAAHIFSFFSAELLGGGSGGTAPSGRVALTLPSGVSLCLPGFPALHRGVSEVRVCPCHRVPVAGARGAGCSLDGFAASAAEDAPLCACTGRALAAGTARATLVGCELLFGGEGGGSGGGGGGDSVGGAAGQALELEAVCRIALARVPQAAAHGVCRVLRAAEDAVAAAASEELHRTDEGVVMKRLEGGGDNSLSSLEHFLLTGEATGGSLCLQRLATMDMLNDASSLASAAGGGGGVAAPQLIDAASRAAAQAALEAVPRAERYAVDCTHEVAAYVSRLVASGGGADSAAVPLRRVKAPQASAEAATGGGGGPAPLHSLSTAASPQPKQRPSQARRRKFAVLADAPQPQPQQPPAVPPAAAAPSAPPPGGETAASFLGRLAGSGCGPRVPLGRANSNARPVPFRPG